MPLLSYPAVLAQHADRRPDDVALVCDEREVGFSELQQRSNRLARDFESRGVGHGDFVTLALPNGVAFVESCFAAWKLGAIPQPVSARLPDRERFAILEHARPALVVGVEAAGAAGFPSLPVGFEPGDFSDASLPDRVSRPARRWPPGAAPASPSSSSTSCPRSAIPANPSTATSPAPPCWCPAPCITPRAS